MDGGAYTRLGENFMVCEAPACWTEGLYTRRVECLVMGEAPCVGRLNTCRVECLVVGEAPVCWKAEHMWC